MKLTIVHFQIFNPEKSVSCMSVLHVSCVPVNFLYEAKKLLCLCCLADK